MRKTDFIAARLRLARVASRGEEPISEKEIKPTSYDKLTYWWSSSKDALSLANLRSGSPFL